MSADDREGGPIIVNSDFPADQLLPREPLWMSYPYTFKEVTVRCLTAVEPGQDCPRGRIVDESTSHPYLVPTLGAAAAVMLGAAVEAFLRAPGQRAEQSEAARARGTRGIGVVAPSITKTGSGMDLDLLWLRLR